jgi:hypothetical protein
MTRVRVQLPIFAALFLVPLFFFSRVTAQTIHLPNPSFEQGKDTPEDWQLSSGDGAWLTTDATDGQRAVAVTGRGENTNYWRSASLPFAPASLYQLSFRARNIDATTGIPISGPVFCNRDLGRPSKWTLFHSIFVTPDSIDSEHSWLRFGQWHADGAVAFDQVELTRAQPLYAHFDEIILGEGESIRGNQYAFLAPYRSQSRNHSRPLVGNTCFFNTYRWVFGADSYVLYRHQIANRIQERAEVEISVNYHVAGSLLVEASTDGRQWTPIGRFDEAGGGTLQLPDDLFPASEIWIRLHALDNRATGTESDPGSFQVDTYGYRAQLRGEPVDLRGTTRFIAVRDADPTLGVQVLGLGDALPGGANVVQLQFDNRSERSLAIKPTVTLTNADGETISSGALREIPPGPTKLWLAYDLPGAGSWDLKIELEGSAHFSAHSDLFLPHLYETSYGERLPGSDADVGLWHASSGWKIGRTRPVPKKTGTSVLIRAARNEAEAAQLVVRPRKPLKRLTASVSDLTGPQGALIPADRIDLLRVHYVPVAQPSDPTGVADLWPDPLPPLRESIDLPGNANQPLWVRIDVPEEAAPGTYSGTIHLRAEAYSVDVPLQVEVYDFSLPRRPTCTTAFGFSFNNIVRYHGLETDQQKRAVLDRYLQNYSAHRISPYDPASMDPLRIDWNGLEPQFDWSAWDAAMTRAIDELGFNSFRLPIQGLGSGTFHARREPELIGYSEETPEYRQALRAYLQGLEQHLRERGWLDEAYVYWFDEPAPRDYDFVMNGFRKLRENAPDINRMLTEQVEPDLIGGPNIWCPVSDSFDPQTSALRMAAGDSFWWYVCTGPKAPYAGLFIDHPGTELRVWLWQTWQRGIEGILVWQSNYWTSDAAYPDGLQNPYEDPMGWTSGYSAPAGVRRAWGNGDGRFVYPPEAAADGTQGRPVLEGPVDSIRWEMLRDGVEDYEYFAILRDLLKGRDDLGVEEHATFEKLLEVPRAVTESMTEFTRDPAPLEAHRHALARAIEELSAR